MLMGDPAHSSSVKGLTLAEGCVWCGGGGCEGAQSSSEKAKSSTMSSSPWVSCSRSDRDIPRGHLLCFWAPWEPVSLPSSAGGKSERCKPCFTASESEASQGNSLLIKPRHSLIYWHHCSALIAVGERCRQLRAALALKNLGQAQRRPEAETQSKNQGA